MSTSERQFGRHLDLDAATGEPDPGREVLDLTKLREEGAGGHSDLETIARNLRTEQERQREAIAQAQAPDGNGAFLQLNTKRLTPNVVVEIDDVQYPAYGLSQLKKRDIDAVVKLEQEAEAEEDPLKAYALRVQQLPIYFADMPSEEVLGELTFDQIGDIARIIAEN